MSQIVGSQVMISFNSHSAGKRMVVGPVTKTNYGYRKHGDVFKVYEADMRVRPDLYIPIKKEQPSPVVAKAGPAPKPEKVLGTAPAPPPPPVLLEETVDLPFTDFAHSITLDMDLSSFEWYRIQKNHLRILREAGITTLADVGESSEEQLLAIKGIGPVVAKELIDKFHEQA